MQYNPSQPLTIEILRQMTSDERLAASKARNAFQCAAQSTEETFSLHVEKDTTSADVVRVARAANLDVMNGRSTL